LQQRDELPVEIVELVETGWTHEAGPACDAPAKWKVTR